MISLDVSRMGGSVNPAARTIPFPDTRRLLCPPSIRGAGRVPLPQTSSPFAIAIFRAIPSADQPDFNLMAERQTHPSRQNFDRHTAPDQPTRITFLAAIVTKTEFALQVQVLPEEYSGGDPNQERVRAQKFPRQQNCSSFSNKV